MTSIHPSLVHEISSTTHVYQGWFHATSLVVPLSHAFDDSLAERGVPGAADVDDNVVFTGHL